MPPLASEELDQFLIACSGAMTSGGSQSGKGKGYVCIPSGKLRANELEIEKLLLKHKFSFKAVVMIYNVLPTELHNTMC